MALQATLPERGTLPLVGDDDTGAETETTGRRIKRLREELQWTQQQLADAAEVTPETVSNVENRPEGARGPRPSVSVLLAALERERQRRAGEPGPSKGRVLVEFLSSAELEDVRVRRIGRNRKVRYVAAIIPDDDATAEDIQQALEEFHREQRRGDG